MYIWKLFKATNKQKQHKHLKQKHTFDSYVIQTQFGGLAQ